MDAIQDAVMEIGFQFFTNYVLQSASAMLQDSYNAGRQEGAEVINSHAAEYSAIQDEATCPACEALDGMIVDRRTPEGEAMYVKYSPAQHGNCRCVWIELLEGDPGIQDAMGTEFQQVFVDRYNAQPGITEPMTLPQIAAQHMHHNVNWGGYVNGNPWANELPAIQDIINSRRKDKAVDMSGLTRVMKSWFEATSEK